jgi:Phosphoenolpyruvate phosphomutase
MNQKEKAKRFAQLHVKGAPLLLYNAWDAGSVQSVLEAGAKAIATSSWSVAAAQGYQDGEAIPIEFAGQIVGRIATSVDTLFRDFALRRYRAFMLERRELHALAARELRQSLADDQRLERVRLLVRRKSGIIGEQLIEEEDAVVRRGPVRPEQERTRLGLHCLGHAAQDFRHRVALAFLRLPSGRERNAAGRWRGTLRQFHHAGLLRHGFLVLVSASEGPAIMRRAPITRPTRNVLSRRVTRSFVERTRPRYAACARSVVTFVSEASGENRVADRLDSAVATRAQDWDHVDPAVREWPACGPRG